MGQLDGLNSDLAEVRSSKECLEPYEEKEYLIIWGRGENYGFPVQLAKKR